MLRHLLSTLIGAATVLPLTAQTRASVSPAPASVAFAASLAVAGDELLVGRRGSPFTPAGAVHVFRRDAGEGWHERAAVTGRGVQPGDAFGTALAAEDGLMVVGAPGHGADGAVFVFARRGDAWQEVAKLERGNGEAGGFGTAVALHGDLLVVGAPSSDSARGAAYAFRRGGDGQWTGPTVLGRGTQPGDRFGASLAASGDRILVGVPGPFPGRPERGGAVLYRATGAGAWQEEARLAPPATEGPMAFGVAVALAGDLAWAGAPAASQGAGAAFVFQYGGGRWTQAARITSPSPSPQVRFGASLAQVDGRLLVGEPGSFQRPGAVHAFARLGTTWTHLQALASPDLGGNAQFGATLAAGEALVLVGAPNADFGEGTAVVFAHDPVAREWRIAGTLVDEPVVLPAVTGGMVRCDSSSNLAAGFDCAEVDLLSFLPVSAIGGRRGIQLNDIWGWTDPETGREYALVGRMDGTSFVDVTDPTQPVYVGDLPLTPGARPNTWRDIKVYRDHAFIVADGAGPHGMQVFDLARLRNPGATPATFTADVVYDRIASAHNIAINEETGFAYSIGNSGGGETCGGALHMIDIREPKNPVFAGCFADPATGLQRTGYTHDTQCVLYRGPDERFRGREICFNSSETAVGVADVTDKANPRALAVASYPNVAYTHQGWLTEDHRYFYVNDEGDEIGGLVPRTRTLVWDMSRLDEPVLANEFFGTTSASDHNLYIRGRYMYQANYVAGLRVIDISDPVNPKEVGYFDTVPWGENTPGFDGAWSNYPFFRSGTIVVSSQGEGLFVLRHRHMEMVP
jgi:choice-of-anchor B domain-containing protein